MKSPEFDHVSRPFRKGRQVAVALSGYATLDFVMMTQAPGDRLSGTCMVRVVADGWPRAGGAALYAARRLVRAGHRATPILAVGEDRLGMEYLSQCIEAGVSTDGIVGVAGARSPVCVLAYNLDGSHTCLLDPGELGERRLSPEQLLQLHAADIVVVAAGPVERSAEILDRIRPDQRLAWIAKKDEQCFPRQLRMRLANRADYVFCNQDERRLVDEALDGRSTPPQIVVETRGREGVLVEWNGRSQVVSVEPIAADDPTGAGDTLAGEVLAHIPGGMANPVEAVSHGIEAARNLLLDRMSGSAVRTTRDIPAGDSFG